MLILTRDDIRKVLDVSELFEAMENGFRMLAQGRVQAPLRTTIDMKEFDGVSLFMPAYCTGLSAAGVKLVTVMSRNPEKGLPLIHSNYLFVSAETGQVLSLMDAEVLTSLRTAVASAVATSHVGKDGGRVLAIFGTGVQAWEHVQVFTKLFGIREVLVFGLTPELSEEFAVRIERQLRVPAKRAILAELKRAEILCTCTTNTEPLFELQDLHPAAHINAMGAYRPHTREIGTDVVTAAVVIVDSYAGALNEAGEFVIPIREGKFRKEQIHASIEELVAGVRPAPETAGKLTLFKSLGMALEDLVAADLAYRKAKEKGIGLEVRV